MKNKCAPKRFLLLALPIIYLAATALVAAAPPIVVSSAEPNEAEQGTVQLTVTINGRGFKENSEVEFYIPGSCDNNGINCNRGGIRVGTVEFVSSKKLKAIIDVEKSAIEGLFDIEVRSNGRRGRGTELFRVLLKGNGGSQTVDCKIDFSVEFRDGAEDMVRSDGIAGGVYPDPGAKRDKSQAFTHSGPGFRFDTNGSQKLEGAGGTRELLTNTIPLSLTSSGVDFRFHLNSGGLDLCSLDSGGAAGTVPVVLAFADNLGEGVALLYGCIKHNATPFTGSGSSVTVTRTGGAVDNWAPGDTWTIEGGNACLITSNNYATGTDMLIDVEVDATFKMTITAQ